MRMSCHSAALRRPSNCSWDARRVEGRRAYRAWLDVEASVSLSTPWVSGHDWALKVDGDAGAVALATSMNRSMGERWIDVEVVG